MMYARNVVTVALILGILSIPMMALASDSSGGHPYGTGLDRPYAVAQAPAMKSQEGKGEPGMDEPGMGELGMGRRGHRGKWKAIAKELGLTPEQQEKLRALKQESHEKMKSVHDNVRKIREEKLAMLRSGKVDQERLTKLDQELVKYRAEMMTERLRTERARLTLLNPEQTKKLGEFMAKKHEERRMKREQKRGEDF